MNFKCLMPEPEALPDSQYPTRKPADVHSTGVRTAAQISAAAAA
jgi:hypothetical protein